MTKQSKKSTNMKDIEKILDLARWAPSGDNEQPWQFEIMNDRHFVVHGHDTSDWCVYDLGGRASQIAIGALLQNIEIASSDLGLQACFSRREDASESHPVIDVHLNKADDIEPSVLLPYIEQRVTQRRPFKTTPLTRQQKAQLEGVVGEKYQVTWIEGRRNRWKMARLLFRSAHIRLTIPEAYEVHKQNIEWGARYSEDKIPDKAIGADWLTLKIMRWTLNSWKRVQFMNHYLAGTWWPRLQMDLLPGFFCAAHFMITAKTPLQGIDDYIEGGKAVQRFWLTATKLELQFQPEMTPLIFSGYTHGQVSFSTESKALSRSKMIMRALAGLFIAENPAIYGVFMGRVGKGKQPESRSIRQPAAIIRNEMTK